MCSTCVSDGAASQGQWNGKGEEWSEESTAEDEEDNDASIVDDEEENEKIASASSKRNRNTATNNKTNNKTVTATTTATDTEQQPKTLWIGKADRNRFLQAVLTSSNYAYLAMNVELLWDKAAIFGVFSTPISSKKSKAKSRR